MTETVVTDRRILGVTDVSNDGTHVAACVEEPWVHVVYRRLRANEWIPFSTFKGSKVVLLDESIAVFRTDPYEISFYSYDNTLIRKEKYVPRFVKSNNFIVFLQDNQIYKTNHNTPIEKIMDAPANVVALLDVSPSLLHFIFSKNRGLCKFDVKTMSEVDVSPFDSSFGIERIVLDNGHVVPEIFEFRQRWSKNHKFKLFNYQFSLMVQGPYDAIDNVAAISQMELHRPHGVKKFDKVDGDHALGWRVLGFLGW